VLVALFDFISSSLSIILGEFAPHIASYDARGAATDAEVNPEVFLVKGYSRRCSAIVSRIECG
jgi:hypothetical protein